MMMPNSDRLTYHLMDEKDKQELFDLDQNSEVMKFITGGKTTSMKEVEDVFLPRMKSYTNINKGWGLWSTNLLSSEEFIGWILVRPMDYFSDEPQFDNIELGWRFKQEFWGKGYATEAARHIMMTLIENKVASQYSAMAFTENTASIGIMKKLGMHFIKHDLHKDPLGDLEVDYYSKRVSISEK